MTEKAKQLGDGKVSNTRFTDIAGYLPYDLYVTRNNFVGVIN
jgi:hypothetical protein